MRTLATFLILAAFGTTTSHAQPSPAATPGMGVKAIQPGLIEVAGARVTEVAAAGVSKITATPGKRRRSIAVESQWGESYFDWPKDLKPVAFTITIGTSATIDAPGFTKATQEDYKAAIERIVPIAVSRTNESRVWSLGSGK